jgi:hypothetical protein
MHMNNIKTCPITGYAVTLPSYSNVKAPFKFYYIYFISINVPNMINIMCTLTFK